MADVEFNDEDNLTLSRPYRSTNSGMSRWLISLGVVSNETQASILLLAVSIIFFVSAVLVIIFR